MTKYIKTNIPTIMMIIDMLPSGEPVVEVVWATASEINKLMNKPQ
jgi:hypothetical protein